MQVWTNETISWRWWWRSSLHPPVPSSSRLLHLQSLQIKFITIQLSVRKCLNDRALQTFHQSFHQSHCEPSLTLSIRTLKAQLRVLLISSLLSGPLHWWSNSSPTLLASPSLPYEWTQWHQPPSPPPALINSSVLPCAHLFPQTNCWQERLS